MATFSVLPRDVGTPFFEGDCYLVLSVQLNGPKHIWMWIGAESSVDERGTLAIKAVELDNALGGAAHQHRVEQGSEDAAFLALFKETGGLRVHAGGYASGFAHVSHFWETPLERLPQLLVRFRTRARRPRPTPRYAPNNMRMRNPNRGCARAATRRAKPPSPPCPCAPRLCAPRT